MRNPSFSQIEPNTDSSLRLEQQVVAHWYGVRDDLRRVRQPLNLRVPHPCAFCKGGVFGAPPSRETTQATERFLTSFAMTKRLYFLSPIEALESGNKIEVLVPAYKREGMLAAERGDPKIVSGNGLAFPFQFEADG